MNSTQQEKAKLRRAKFAALLRDMFQLNEPELDFGLYRIMHAKQEEVNRFIEHDLPKLAQEAFKDFAGQDKAQLEKDIAEARKAAEALGINPDDLPKVKELEAQYHNGFDTVREEGEVYDALVTFFSRYYDEGDFISRRVYKDGTYAIPYQGEEVVLHWANKDQYYVKSSEYLRDYAFRLMPHVNTGENPLRIHFKIVDATAGAKDNNKETDDSKRQFILDVKQPFEWITGEPDSQGNRFEELVCRFEFRPATLEDWDENVKKKATAAAQKKAPTQEHLVDIAVSVLLGDSSELPDTWKEALSRPYVKANGEPAAYSTLEGQLKNYVKKNTFDYFIHKDLGGFLNRELDFYIKNELMQWEDLAALKNNPARFAPLLSKLEVIRDLGSKIIAFLAQLENFQKKLWLKKKFVTETNYCITLDRVPKDLYPEICTNEAQIEEWIKLFAIDEIKGDLTSLSFSNPLSIEFLDSNQNLVLDTRFFNETFKSNLIASIEGFDQQCDGLLVHSENFQALNFLQEYYRDQVKCIYIDPPYNTEKDRKEGKFLYKDSYETSSWASLYDNRLELAKKMLRKDAFFMSSIDDNEIVTVKEILRSFFGKENFISSIIWHNSSRSSGKHISTVHEYVEVFANSVSDLNEWKVPREEFKDICNEVKGIYINKGESFALKKLNEYIKNKIEESPDDYRFLRNYSKITEEGDIFYAVDLSGDGQGEPRYFSDRNVTLPAPKGRHWMGQKFIDDLIEQKRLVWFGERPYRVALLKEAMENPQGIIRLATRTGKHEIESLFGSSVFKNPKPSDFVFSLIKPGLLDISDSNNIVLDYFSGSGTTGHAVINLNREDNGKRKYILIEMGSHFDTVLKPRLAKVVYSSEWKNGKPESRDTGISHCIKYIRLESYEDTLNNLRLNQPRDLFSQSSDDEARQAYVMNYMIDVETRGSQSLLNIDQFINPTEYQLNIRSASGDETVPVKVDLLETFNYLLGLEVEHIAAPIYFDADVQPSEYGRMKATVKQSPEGKWWFRTVYGKNRNGQYVLVVWRNMPSVIEAGQNAEKRAEAFIIDNAVLDAVLVERLKIRLTESVDDEIDVLYVNGDNNISIPRDRKGNPMEQARVQLIEDAFKRLMFADTEAVH